MSKAFTRELDDVPERRAPKRLIPAVPPGAKNYITERGADSLRREAENLAAGVDSPAARQRITEIRQILESVVATPPPPLPWDRVLFGATVSVRDQRGEETGYRIVGLNEVDLDRDWISWLSPLAKALLKARVGDHVHFRAPGGDQNLDILAVTYD